MKTERKQIVQALKMHHDAFFTPGVYEHSIFGKAALLLEEPEDTTEVVRCAECKYSFQTEDGMVRCSFHSERNDFDDRGSSYNVWMEPTDFCSYGERGSDE